MSWGVYAYECGRCRMSGGEHRSGARTSDQGKRGTRIAKAQVRGHEDDSGARKAASGVTGTPKEPADG